MNSKEHLADKPARLDMRQAIGHEDIVMLTLDTLRYDVAQEQFLAGNLPVLAECLPPSGWQLRHTSGSFTYAAHHAFFAGFLPTPATPGWHPRLFASAFRGSETIAKSTFVFDEADLPAALAARGYSTICIGGTGFFNQQTALGQVLPKMFMESHWTPGFSVTQRHSAERQIALACQRLQTLAGRVFLFINISAIHSPNHMYLAGCQEDNLASHAAALRYVDQSLAPLLQACRKRGQSLWVVCADHGTAYGEDGFHGHRLAHPSVWQVPYAEFILAAETIS